MTEIEIAGQIISLAAMACAIFSFQMKKQKYLILLQLFAGALFSTSYFMLGAIVGGLLNIVAVIRAVVFLFCKKLNPSHPAWLFGFTAVYLIFYALSFALFGTEPILLNFIVELLPIIAMTVSHIGFMSAKPRIVRRLGLAASPMWIIYNIYYVSIGAIICEIITLCSICIGMLRHDRKKK